MKNRWLSLLLLIALIATTIMYWPASEIPVVVAPPLDQPQARSLPDDQLVIRLTQDISGRLLRAKHRPEAWKELPEPSRQLWLATTMEHQLLGGFLTFLMSHADGKPDLTDASSALTAMGTPKLSVIVDEAKGIANGPGQLAIQTCREYMVKEHTPSFIRPADFIDPFADCDARFRDAAKAADLGKLRLAYAKQHLNEIVTQLQP